MMIIGIFRVIAVMFNRLDGIRLRKRDYIELAWKVFQLFARDTIIENLSQLDLFNLHAVITDYKYLYIF